MTQKQAKAELKYRLAKYVLQVLLDAGTITAEEMELARKKLCKKISAIHPLSGGGYPMADL